MGDAVTNDKCEVCSGTTPPGHRICDRCWPDSAIAAGLAALCAVCGAPKVLEKLRKDAKGRMLCATHSEL
jgi:hypothetical protein